MSSVAYCNTPRQFKVFTLDCAKPQGTYDVCVATKGGVKIRHISIYVKQVPVGIQYVTIQTNQATPVMILDVQDGIAQNLTLEKQLDIKTPHEFIFLEEGQKLTYTLHGNGTAGMLWLPMGFYGLDKGNRTEQQCTTLY